MVAPKDLGCKFCMDLMEAAASERAGGGEMRTMTKRSAATRSWLTKPEGEGGQMGRPIEKVGGACQRGMGLRCLEGSAVANAPK